MASASAAATPAAPAIRTPSPTLGEPVAVELSLLGDFALHHAGAPVPVCRTAQRVLAYLALSRGRPVRRTAAAEGLWREAPTRRAASSLRSALWRIPRCGSSPLVAATATHVQLAPGTLVDLWVAEDQARELTRHTGALTPELGLARLTDDLLPDWDEDWLLLEQESYRQVRLHALEALSENLRSIGRYPDALLAALAAVRSEPLRETAHRRVIEIHLAEGNPAEALRQYQTYRHLIADALGLPPSAGIRRLVGPLLGRPVDSPGASTTSAPVGAAARMPG